MSVSSRSILEGLAIGHSLGAPIGRAFEQQNNRDFEQQMQDQKFKNAMTELLVQNPDLLGASTQIQPGNSVDGQQSVQPLPFTQAQKAALLTGAFQKQKDGTADFSGNAIPQSPTIEAGGYAINPADYKQAVNQTKDEDLSRNLKFHTDIEKIKQGFATDQQLNQFKQQKELLDQKGAQALAQGDQNAANQLKVQSDLLQKKIDSGMFGTPGGGLTQDSIDAAAERFNLDGTIPSFGLGKSNAQLKTAIMNRAQELRNDSGVSVADQLANQSGVKASQGELKKLQSQRGPVMAFADTAQKNLGLVSDLSDKVDNTGVPVLNRWINAGKRSIEGDPDVAKFDAAVQTAVNEYAKVTSSATGGGVTSDSARAHIESLLNTSQSPKQIKGVIDILTKEIDNRAQGYDNQINKVKSAISGKPSRSQQGQSLSITPAIAQDFMIKAGGDKTKAKQLAKDAGYQF